MDWLYENWQVIYHAILTVIFILIATIILVRIYGLRSFAKMTSIDFVSTITIGSIISSTIMSDSNSLLKGVIAITIILLIQTLFSFLKIHTSFFGKIAENQPVFLFRDGKFLEENMKKALVEKDDILAKLRESNAYNLSKVYAIILEVTGDISVLHGDEPPQQPDLIYEDVKRI